jgi:hypothetical protein
MATNPNDWELIDDGSFNGVKKYIRATDDDEGTVSVRYDAHDAPIILERNKRAQNDWNGKLGELNHAAHIPASTLIQWYAQDGYKAVLLDPDYLARKLNDPDWKYLKRLPIQL